MTTLFIIEAPGKARHFERLLSDIGIPCVVQATKGHLFNMPFSPGSSGIDSRYRDYQRSLINPDIARRIRECAMAAEVVYVATDADLEGDVIAWDIVELLSDINRYPLRVRLRGMDPESVKHAISMAKPVEKADAIPGRTRAIIDRMIGGVFSNNGVAVGRVSSALLGLVRDVKPAVSRLQLIAPSVDGGRPWVAMCKIMEPISNGDAYRLSQLKFPPLSTKRKLAREGRPVNNMGMVMVRAGDEMDLSPKEAAISLQRLYEAGRLSYPRAEATGISPSVMRKLANELRKAGYTFNEELTPDKSEHSSHDAPYPIGEVLPHLDPQKQGQDDGLRTLIARDLIRTGQSYIEEVAIGDVVGDFLRAKGFADPICVHIARLNWKRDVGPRYPGQESWPKSKIIERRPDIALLDAAVECNLGRPSTWATHITNFMERALVDDELRLTAKGIEWAARTPPALLDYRVSTYIERQCEGGIEHGVVPAGREPWEVLAERIVSNLPSAISDKLKAAVGRIAPQSKLDWRMRLEPPMQVVKCEHMADNPSDSPDLLKPSVPAVGR